MRGLEQGGRGGIHSSPLPSRGLWAWVWIIQSPWDLASGLTRSSADWLMVSARPRPPSLRVPGGSGPLWCSLFTERAGPSWAPSLQSLPSENPSARGVGRKPGRAFPRHSPSPTARRGRVRGKRCVWEGESRPAGFGCHSLPVPCANPGVLSLGLAPAPSSLPILLRVTCPPWASSQKLDLRDARSLEEAQTWRLHS